MIANDELQKRMAEQMEFVLSQTPEALAAENAKLRELVTDMCVWAYIDSYCDLQQEFAVRMRELGVEVDG